MGWMRHPKTYQEMRYSWAGARFVRAARRPHNLPTVWDDLWRYPMRSWKKHRKTQFKLVEK